jgi:hypothetical protein
MKKKTNRKYDVREKGIDEGLLDAFNFAVNGDIPMERIDRIVNIVDKMNQRDLIALKDSIERESRGLAVVAPLRLTK